jgi:4-azaleucine resistance transporter AzlC
MPRVAPDRLTVSVLSGDPRASFRAGVLSAIPFMAAGCLLGISFGVLAVGAGVPVVAAIVMSGIVHAGSAQFAALAVMTGGGSIPTAVVAGTLMNGRFLPMGLALGPSIPGGPLQRAAGGQAVVDASWALSNLGGGRFDRHKLYGATALQWCGWTGGTAIGALSQGAFGDLDRFGIDAVYPAFFVALLVLELREGRGRLVAFVGAAVALALSPITPAGVPVLVASLVALLGLRGADGPRTPTGGDPT